jgi:Asp-tRNA(Asn)/Glu-tRNA(Gln) amidotransferase A subunit family amidase
MIIAGKTNAAEFGLLPASETLHHGSTVNPWDSNLTSGGSSGGSAAAVAAGIVPMAHGNDGGGSIRIPASCCGIFGIKPTRGRNPSGPLFGDMGGGIAHEHAVTRTVRDSAALSFVVFTRTQNITGQPAMSVPLFWNGDNVPIGVQFAGRFGDEALLFRLAAQLEQARPWVDKIPPIHISRL